MMDTINNEDKSDLHGYTPESPTYNKKEIIHIKELLKKPGKGLSEINWDKLLLSNFNDCQPKENVDAYKVFQLLDIQEKIIEPNNLKFKPIKKEELEKLKQKKYYLCK